MKNKEIYIHIGYPKTATTTFKNNLFSKHKDFYYLRNDSDSLPLLDKLFYSRENSFKRFMNSYKEVLSNKVKATDLSKFILSEESLTSFSMFFRLRPSPYVWTTEPNSIARKIKIAFKDTLVFEKVKIIIVIRKQDELIKSIYAQAYNLVFKRFKETRNFPKFLEYILNKNGNDFLIDSLFYEDVINEYEKLFGKENICIQIFEELRENKESYLKKLCGFLGININEAIKLLDNKHLNKKSSSTKYKSDDRSLMEIISYYKVKYFGSKSYGYEKSNLGNFLKQRYVPGKKLSNIQIPPSYLEIIKDIYKDSNMRISKKFNLGLEKYGYDYE